MSSPKTILSFGTSNQGPRGPCKSETLAGSYEFAGLHESAVVRPPVQVLVMLGGGD